MGISYNGICYPSVGAAVLQFRKDVSVVDTSGAVSLVGLPSTTANSIVWTVTKTPFDGTPAVTVSGTTKVLGCTETMDQWPVQSLLLIFALFFAAFVGFKTGYRT